jgi:type IV pilus assembly protein PilZ
MSLLSYSWERSMNSEMAEGSARRFPRIDLEDEVYLEGEHTLKAARWTDIGPGGIFVQTKTPLPVGEMVQLKIRLPGDAKPYQAAGIVRHSMRWVGMGLEFTHVPFPLKDTLQQILSRLQIR